MEISKVKLQGISYRTTFSAKPNLLSRLHSAFLPPVSFSFADIADSPLSFGGMGIHSDILIGVWRSCEPFLVLYRSEA